MKKFFIYLFAFLGSSLPLFADVPLRTLETWRFEAWTVSIVQNENNGKVFCAAETKSIANQIFRIALYQDHDAFFEILDDSWNFPENQPAIFILRFDSEEIIFEGRSWVGALTWDLVDPEYTAVLFANISQKKLLEVRAPNEALLARFSLRGSSQAMEALFVCWDNILGEQI